MAARYIPLRKSLRVILVGVAMGLVVMVMTQVTDKWVAFPLLIIIGGLSGFFVVPMNALLQHRGHVLMSAGQSIAIQNFNENLSVLTMLGLYAVLIHLNFHVNTVIILFGSFVTAAMVLVYFKHRSNQRRFNVEAKIGHE